MVQAKKKGSNYELQVIKLFKELGFTSCASSRSCNRALDDAKVDIAGLLDLNVQCKAVEATIDLHKVLESMPADEKINIVFHKKNRREPVIALHQKDFIPLLKLMIEHGVIKLI